MSEGDLGTTLVGLLGELIAIPSIEPPGDTRAICAHVAKRFEAAGYETEILGRRQGVDNVVARAGRGKPSLALNCHIDTVDAGARDDWASDPFRATIKDGKVFGLGANNCKGSTAVHLWLGEEIMRRGGPAKGEIVFTFTGDEERLGPDGMRFLRDSGTVAPDIMLVGAPTENHLITEERGVLWVRLTTTGRAAHGGDPAAGDNAILRMIRLIEALETDLGPRLSERRAGEKLSTMNIGRIRGGHNVNVVPSSCTLEIDRRLLPGETVDQAFAEIETLVQGAGEPAGSCVVEFLTGTNGFSAPPDGPGVSALVAAIEARTGRPPQFLNALAVGEGRYFADDGIEIVSFGPGDGATSHAPNEHVPIDQMVDAAVILQDVVQRLVGAKG